MSVQGYLHSIQSLGTVDGPGVRSVVFLTGCPLRCSYCHNPDAWQGGTLSDSAEVVDRLRRFFPYIKDGGVTFSGGEPCLQPEFVADMAKTLRACGIHTALDTSGAILNEQVKRMLTHVDLVLLDVKMTTEADYVTHTGGHLGDVLAFLTYLEEIGKPVWIRHVVVPGINDGAADLARLRDLLAPYTVIERVELLPFKNLCIEKYRTLGIPFPLENVTPMTQNEWAAFCARSPFGASGKTSPKK